MKKISLSAVAFLLTLVTFAQHTEFGLKGGVNITNLNDASFPNTGSRTGLHVGGLAHIHLSPNWAVQPEAVFSTQGAKYGTGTAKLNYINVPAVVQYMFAEGFRLETGPQVGFIVSAKAVETTTERNIINSLKTIDFAWAFGAGFITKTGVGFDARYNLGITNINETTTYKDQHRVWQLGLFYQFRH